MCQLTFIDIKSPEYLPQDFFRLLILSNAFENNFDGFGFYLFEEKVIRKSSEDAIKWFNNQKNKKLWDDIKNPLGIYHVRRASIKAQELKDEHAHPFYEHNTVLAHNGTLTMKYHDKNTYENNWKHDGDNLIDSQFLLRTLNAIRGNEVLNADHIDKAIKCFTGTYALLIHDTMVKNSLWIARGDEQKTLWKLIILRNKHPVGMILNTKVYMLNMLIQNLLTFSPTNRGLSFDIELLKEQQIYNYEVGTYNLNPVKSTEVYKVVNYNKVDTGKKVDIKTVDKDIPKLPSPVIPLNIFAELVEYTIGLGLSFVELNYIYESLFYDNIFQATEDEIEHLLTVMEELYVNYNYDGRRREWSKLCNNYFANKGKYTVYDTTGLKFPFILNTKNDLQELNEQYEKAITTGDK